MSKPRSAFANFAAISFLMAAALTAFFWWRIGLDPVASWLVAINLTALIVYGADKNLAENRRPRVPEKLLMLLALLFGSLGAWLGMQIFRHKTSKRGFQIRFWIVVVIQVLLVVFYYAYVLPLLR